MISKNTYKFISSLSYQTIEGLCEFFYRLISITDDLHKLEAGKLVTDNGSPLYAIVSITPNYLGLGFEFDVMRLRIGNDYVSLLFANNQFVKLQSVFLTSVDDRGFEMTAKYSILENWRPQNPLFWELLVENFKYKKGTE